MRWTCPGFARPTRRPPASTRWRARRRRRPLDRRPVSPRLAPKARLKRRTFFENPHSDSIPGGGLDEAAKARRDSKTKKPSQENSAAVRHDRAGACERTRLTAMGMRGKRCAWTAALFAL